MSCVSQLKPIIESLASVKGIDVFDGFQKTCSEPLPHRAETIDIMETLRGCLFPGYFGNSSINEDSLLFYIGTVLDSLSKRLNDQIKRAFALVDGSVDEQKTKQICLKFFSTLPEIRSLLLTDLQAAFDGDPAVYSKAEIILSYPGFRAITNHRVAHVLHHLGVPILPRMISAHAHNRTAIDIHPGVQIGESFFMDHGTVIVVGETCVIGKNVKLYQGVTLGAKSFPLDDKGHPVKGIPRHPILEDGVIVYASATILGRVTIGKNSIIAGNVWLTESVPPFSKIK